jgi:hypothetical protein
MPVATMAVRLARAAPRQRSLAALRVIGECATRVIVAATKHGRSVIRHRICAHHPHPRHASPRLAQPPVAIVFERSSAERSKPFVRPIPDVSARENSERGDSRLMRSCCLDAQQRSERVAPSGLGRKTFDRDRQDDRAPQHLRTPPAAMRSAVDPRDVRDVLNSTRPKRSRCPELTHPLPDQIFRSGSD